MQYSPTFTSGTEQFIAGLNKAMHAEQQFARIIPQIMPSICSAQLNRTLRQALVMSTQHQQQLASSYETSAKVYSANGIDDLEKQISAVTAGIQNLDNSDLIYTSLIAKMVQHKIGCYEQVLDISEAEKRQTPQRVLGAALSDETATLLFLQELSERLFLRQFPEQKLPKI